jgi:hypothetical protein
MHEIYVREAIENGLADSIEGRKASVEDVRASLIYQNESKLDCCRTGSVT